MRYPFLILTIVVLGLVTFGVSGEALAQKQDQQPSGTWKLVFDCKLDGKLEEAAFAQFRLDIRADRIIGKVHEPSPENKELIFTGEIISGTDGASLILLRQTGPGRNAVFVGRLVGKHRFAGTWMSGSGAGEFELTFVEK